MNLIKVLQSWAFVYFQFVSNCSYFYDIFSSRKFFLQQLPTILGFWCRYLTQHDLILQIQYFRIMLIINKCRPSMIYLQFPSYADLAINNSEICTMKAKYPSVRSLSEYSRIAGHTAYSLKQIKSMAVLGLPVFNIGLNP